MKKSLTVIFLLSIAFLACKDKEDDPKPDCEQYNIGYVDVTNSSQSTWSLMWPEDTTVVMGNYVHSGKTVTYNFNNKLGNTKLIFKKVNGDGRVETTVNIQQCQHQAITLWD